MFTRHLGGITLPPTAQACSASGIFHSLLGALSVLFFPLQAQPSTSEQHHISIEDLVDHLLRLSGASFLPLQLLALSACRAVVVPLQPLLVIMRPLPVWLCPFMSHIRTLS